MLGKYNFLLLIFCIWLQNGRSVAADIDLFDRILFAQSWPKAVCLKSKDVFSYTCSLVKKDTWTIRGMWPMKKGVKRGPTFCKNSPFEIDQVESVVQELNDFWPNIYGGAQGSRDSLWSYEWGKYGTCIATLPALDSELKYFTQGLTWLKQYNIFDILYEGGIIPSDEETYPVENVYEALYNRLQVKPIIMCYQDDGKEILQDIRMCFDNSLKLIDCDGSYSEDGALRILSNCRNDVYYYEKGPGK